MFLADTLGLDSVDAGHGWLIFSMPRSEVAVHPAQASGTELYLMCDDLPTEIASLAARGVSCSVLEEARWDRSRRSPYPVGVSLDFTSRDIQSRSTAADKKGLEPADITVDLRADHCMVRSADGSSSNPLLTTLGTSRRRPRPGVCPPH